MLFTVVLFSILATGVLCCGFARDGDIYYPLDVCFFRTKDHYSYHHTCYGSQLHDVVYDGSLQCSGKAVINDSTMAQDYYCNITESCDYIELSTHEPNKESQSVIDCDNIGSTTHASYNYARIINKCLHQASDNRYRLDICTENKWNTIYYSDSLCDDSIARYPAYVDICTDGADSYTEIVECTAPINDIGDECGYVQYDKNTAPSPLNECFIKDSYSFMFSCVNNNPMYYQWSLNECDLSMTPDLNFSIGPFAYSCSPNQCEWAEIKMYQDDNCTQFTSTTEFTTDHRIINRCFNWFGTAHTSLSSIFMCDESTLSVSEMTYNGADCDESNGIHAIDIWSQDCETNNDFGINYKIECHTTIPSTTTFTTTFTTTPLRTQTTSDIYNVVVYITTNGSDHQSCGDSELNGCGTLFYGSAIAAHIANSDPNVFIELIVQGQNVISIQKWTNYQISQGMNDISNPCLPHSILTSIHNVSITFDTNYIHQMNDWYNTSLCEAMVTMMSAFIYSPTGVYDTTIIVNNLIIDSYVFEGHSSQPQYIIKAWKPVICNYCQFNDIIIDSNHHSVTNVSALIIGSNIRFDHCLFKNISYTPSSLSNNMDEYQYDYSFIIVDNIYTESSLDVTYIFRFEIVNSEIYNIFMLNAFATLYPSVSTFDFVNANGSLANVVPVITASIENNLFDEISVVSALFNNEPPAGDTIQFSIINTCFFNLNFGSVLHSIGKTSNITIYNVNITTKQTIEEYIEEKQKLGRDDTDLHSLFVFDDSNKDLIMIRNVNVKYYYVNYLSDHCRMIQGRGISPDDWFTMEMYWPQKINFWSLQYYCKIPIQFMDNSVASVFITDLSVSNDINEMQFGLYRDSILAKYSNNTIRKIYIDFMYDNAVLDYAFLYNEGTMNIESLNVYGIGAHYKMIHNPSGDLFVYKLIAIPETYCDDTVCAYDSDALQISWWINFGTESTDVCGAQFILENSIIYGQKAGFTIDINYGNAYLNNVTIQMAMNGIWASSYSTLLQISSSLMKDIGKYYGSSFSYLDAWNPAFVSFYFDSQSTIIKDTVFSFIDPLQFDMFDPEYFTITNRLMNENENAEILLIDNIFEINDENVLVPYPFQHSLYTIFNDGEIDLNQYFLEEGLMMIRDNINIKMINNEFRVNVNNLYIDDSTLIQENIPWIYVNNSNGNTCLSGNTYTDFAISLNEGNITSCIKQDILQYFAVSDCESYGTFGSSDVSIYDYNQEKRNTFYVETEGLPTIIHTEFDTFIALDNTIVNVNLEPLNESVNILNIIQGNFLFVDVIINASNWEIHIADDCDVVCYSTLNNNTQFIPILHTLCDNENNMDILMHSLNKIYKADTVNHWSPHSIDIYAHNDGLYFPGDRMTFSYSIYDVFNNTIDAIHQELFITLNSVYETDLYAQFPLTINKDGICSVCVSGILFITATLDLVGNSYLLSADVSNAQLFVNDLINITITKCPSGYGSTGTTNQCDMCNKGFFSLMPTTSSCFHCQQDNVDGISCPGGNEIIVDYSYWITVIQSIEDQYIISGKCPASYCCSLKETGCDFLRDNESLCANNRDHTTYLCGKCNDGYSELFGTNACGKCSNKYWYRIFIPIVFGLLLSIYIITAQSVHVSAEPLEQIKKSKPNKYNGCYTKKNKKEYDAKAITKKEFLDTLELFLSKCAMYYYQTLSNLLLSTSDGVSSTLISFVALFNFDVLSKISGSNSNDGYCLFSNLTAISKIVIQLTTTLSVVFFIFVIYILSYLSLNILKPLKRRPNFGRAFLKTSFLCVGQILSVLLQILSCRKIGNVNVHYFFGSHQCYDMLWYLALSVLIIVVLYFIILFIMIRKKMRNASDQNSNNAMYISAIWCYTERHWYWELVLFIRRLFLAFVLIVFDSKDLKMYTVLILMIYLFIHIKSNPFKYKIVNDFESYLIASTILLITMDTIYGNDPVNVSAITLTSALIVFPICFAICYVVSSCNHITNDDQSQYRYDNNVTIKETELVKPIKITGLERQQLTRINDSPV